MARRAFAGLLFIAAFIALATSCGATRFYAYRSARQQLKVVSEHTAALRDFTTANVILTGEYNATLGEIGWDTLRIETNPQVSDEEQAYAAGYFEGKVTYQRAWDHYQNILGPKGVNAKILAFFDANIAWMEQQIALNNKTDPYWYQVGLMWLQWQGLRDGLNSVAVGNQTFSMQRLMSMTSMGDLFDLRAAFDPTSDAARDWRKMPKKEFDNWFARNTHCSALFKVTTDFSNIYFGHASWYMFNAQTRIYKIITLNYNSSSTQAKTISMSSYPGMLSSFDDFYLLDSGMAVIETSLSILNASIYKGNIFPETLPYWMRVMVSNRMATSPQHWTELVAFKNSGTYNNQWLVLHLSRFQPGKALPEGFMWIAEQVPGLVATRDVTQQLALGYVPSYNVPQIKEVFWLAGYGEAVERQGPEMNSYDMCVRAQIFRRDQTSVVDLASMQHILQYNNFEQDPISQGNPLYAIASRGDLNPTRPQCFGAYDAKVSSWRDWKDGMKVHAFSGPTPQQPRFGFNVTRAACGPHTGINELIQFDWMTFTPTNL